MRIIVTDDCIKLWASARDTKAWANMLAFGRVFPRSTLAGQLLFAEFDRDGLVDTDAGEDVDEDELSAFCADVLEQSGKVSARHPARFAAIDQHL